MQRLLIILGLAVLAAGIGSREHHHVLDRSRQTRALFLNNHHRIAILELGLPITIPNIYWPTIPTKVTSEPDARRSA